MPRRRHGPPKASSLPYYPTDPGPLYCWLCGMPQEAATWSKRMPPGFTWENPLWSKAFQEYTKTPMSRRRKFSLYMSTSDINISFKNRFQWLTIFRAIVQGPDGKSLPEGYHLSGIGYMRGAKNGRHLLACQDPATACLGAARKNSDTPRLSPVQHPFILRYGYSFPVDGKLNAYTVHSRCWDLIERKFGPLATSRLDLIAAALRKQWDEIVPRISRPPYPQSSHLFHNFGESQGLEEHDQYQDPMFTDELDALLQDCTNLLTNQDLRKTVSFGILSSKYNVPLEITYLIAGNLNLKDTYNMLVAFGEQFPVSYWKRQVPVDIVFEFKDFGPDPFLWGYIASEIESRGILESHGIWSRKRILGMLEFVKQLVDKELEREQDGKQEETRMGDS